MISKLVHVFLLENRALSQKTPGLPNIAMAHQRAMAHKGMLNLNCNRESETALVIISRSRSRPRFATAANGAAIFKG